MPEPTPQPTHNPYPQQLPAKKKGGCFKWGAIVGGCLLVLQIASMLGDGDSTDISAVSPTTQQQAIKNIAAAPQETKAAITPSPANAATTPSVPREFKNALRSAEQYSKLMHMSKAGIYDQLTSEYGEKFSAEAAQYAIDTIKVDWNKNALESAKKYQDSMAMSSDAIYDQLVSEYGEKFTPEQANYAISNLPQ
ncbi:Ltp family lipoprotein [Corynebacterium pseudotuberculosis]|uniref:Ltp family lipoprotein n=1 Tax=Corynebacterium pseudotuberculosis TaxID=1719 RepID=UPI0001DD444F|nr:Ltp family lipoprotein [Corynebacterium pseudotuberculosis]ADK28413.1 hypothetical protein CPFRC_03105 [Corynebacterium pseudotuberculosis FRC41]ADL20510.1 hypothetical protein CP1002_10030 [Corynebacterium pseudotuberculosis 1002]AEP69874.1 Hypothetical protein Cp4202_0611 [Corynebacterium pseudotuberculosis 42/02-A]AFH51548.1 Hypothetical protein Cp267_0645 [Corynebacterium pseudotuberculosis 267]AEX39096.1 Hypothetical protein Cp3995_0628 [Corynebacterium pseudotuberculosis 3/99-5]